MVWFVHKETESDMPDRTPFTMIDNNDNSRPLKLVRFHPRVRARKINNRDSISERMKQRIWVADEEIIKNKKKYLKMRIVLI